MKLKFNSLRKKYSQKEMLFLERKCMHTIYLLGQRKYPRYIKHSQFNSNKSNLINRDENKYPQERHGMVNRHDKVIYDKLIKKHK